jgi:hypothetical protein
MGTKISALPAASSIVDTDLIPIVNGGVTKSCTPAQIRATPTGTGFVHITAGVQDGAAALVVNADVNAAAAIAGTKIAPDFGAQDIATTGTLGLGATPRATLGDVKVKYNFIIRGRNGANTQNADLLAFGTSSNDLYLGDQSIVTNTRVWANSSAGLAVSGNSDYALVTTGTGLAVFTGGVTALVVGSSAHSSALPMIGSGTAWGANDAITTQPMADANQTPAAAVYQAASIKTTGAITANRNLTLPAATDAQSYEKTIVNTCTGAFSIVVTTGAGGTVTIANGKTAKIRVDSTGTTRVTADT